MRRRSTEVDRFRKRYRPGYDYLHVAVDDHSRVAFVRVFSDEQGETAARFLLEAAGFFADRGTRIERVLTDRHNSYRLSGPFNRPSSGSVPAQAHPRLLPPDQRQGRTIHPDHARRVGLRPALPVQRGTPEGPASVDRLLQFEQAPHRVGRPPADGAAVDNVGGNHT